MRSLVSNFIGLWVKAFEYILLIRVCDSKDFSQCHYESV